MKRVVVLLLVLGACPALADELPPAPSPTYVPPYYVAAPSYYVAHYDWGGVYLGVNGGYGFGSSSWSDPHNAAKTTGNFSTSGGIVGGTVGANYQVNTFVLGAEADFDLADIRGSRRTTAGAKAVGFCNLLVTGGKTPTTGDTCNTSNTWLNTVRARVGYAADRVLIFLTGGVAFGGVETGLSGGNLATTSDNKTINIGWTGGGGVEVGFAPNWSVKVEYLFVNLGTASCTIILECGSDSKAAPPVIAPNDSIKLTESLVRIGVNYKFP